MPRALTATLVAVALLGAVACSSDDDDSTDATTSEQALCDSLAQLDAAITDLEELDLVGEGTNGLQQRVEAVRSALGSVAEDAGSTYEPAVQDLEDAFDALSASVQDVTANGVDPVRAALTQVSDAWQGLQDQTDQVRATCDS